MLQTIASETKSGSMPVASMIYLRWNDARREDRLCSMFVIGRIRDVVY